MIISDQTKSECHHFTCVLTLHYLVPQGEATFIIWCYLFLLHALASSEVLATVSISCY